MFFEKDPVRKIEYFGEDNINFPMSNNIFSFSVDNFDVIIRYNYALNVNIYNNVIYIDYPDIKLSDCYDMKCELEPWIVLEAKKVNILNNLLKYKDGGEVIYRNDQMYFLMDKVIEIDMENNWVEEINEKNTMILSKKLKNEKFSSFIGWPVAHLTFKS